VLLDARPRTPGLAVASYFPSELTVHAGDRIAFYNQSYTDEHTVTFGDVAAVDAVLMGGRADPRLATGCSLGSADAAATGCLITPSWNDLPAYAGTGYWNSGYVSDQGSVTVPIDRATPPGTYAFRCLVHPGMTGTLHVVAPGTEITSAADVHAQALEGADDAAAAADAAPPAPPELGSNDVAAGWTEGDVTVNAFAPRRIVIRAGDEVTWHVSETHDIAFDSLNAPERGSGVLDDGDTYTVRFPRPGTYAYHDSMHVGMTGVVVVR
jgi:plastocyanin